MTYFFIQQCPHEVQNKPLQVEGRQRNEGVCVLETRIHVTLREKVSSEAPFPKKRLIFVHFQFTLHSETPFLTILVLPFHSGGVHTSHHLSSLAWTSKVTSGCQSWPHMTASVACPITVTSRWPEPVASYSTVPVRPSTKRTWGPKSSMKLFRIASSQRWTETVSRVGVHMSTSWHPMNSSSEPSKQGKTESSRWLTHAQVQLLGQGSASQLKRKKNSDCWETCMQIQSEENSFRKNYLNIFVCY